MFFSIIELDETGSTNSELMQLAHGGAANGSVMIAAKQSQGRGRYGRNWQSGEGNLLFSVLLKPDCSPKKAAEIAYVAACSMHRAVSNLYDELKDLTFKWPNDIMASGRKFCGILMESSLIGGVVENLVLGIGVNLKSYPETGVDYPATSLSKESGKEIAPRILLDEFLEVFGRDYDVWQIQGFEIFRNQWLSHASGRGEKITIQSAGEKITGRFDEIEPSGALVLRLENGEIRYINAGDIYFKS